MKLLKRVVIILISTLALYVGASDASNSEGLITNVPASNPSFAFPQTPAIPPHAPTGMQVIKSLLGVEVKFTNGNVDYAGPTIVNDPRYQALTNSEKLVDAIIFKPLQAPPFLLLIAIAKSPNGVPTIIPGKFDIVQKTEQNGFVLKDSHGRLFYYSGYILATPIWKILVPGQTLPDKFCKMPVPMTACAPNDVVNIALKKPLDSSKDIPFLALVK